LHDGFATSVVSAKASAKVGHDERDRSRTAATGDHRAREEPVAR
jgi:hypothetical protein